MVTTSQFGSSSANAQNTIAIVNEIFESFPGRFRFTSGYRTPARNKAVGGVANSFHVTGEAADFVPIDGNYPSAERSQIARVIAKYGYEVIYHNAGSGFHYHIEPAPGGKRQPADPISRQPADSISRRDSPGVIGQISTGAIMLFAVVFILLISDD